MMRVRHLQCFYGCSRLITNRGLRNRAKPRQPGIERRLKIATEDTPDIENMKSEDLDVDAMEANLMQAGEISDTYFGEIHHTHRKRAFKAVERKHFTPDPEPNMLTWAEKEQIRFLHNDNPNHWTEERLAESFPAMPSIIKKLLKSMWKPNSAERIQKHDKQVASNWSAFTRGELQIHDPYLKQHLNKFTSRRNSVSLLKTEVKHLVEKQLVKPQSSEFSSIISSYMVLKNEQSKQQITDGPAVGEINIREKQARTYFNDKATKSNKREKQVQLEELKAIIKNKLNVKTPEIDREIIKNNINTTTTTAATTTTTTTTTTTSKADGSHYIYSAPSEQFDSDAVATKQPGENNVIQFSYSMYPNKIQIPEDKYVKGCLYKVKDCFYDDDGKFLYRVPGLF